MRRIQVAVFAISCVLSASLSLVPRASAWWKQVHVSGCTLSPYAADLNLVYTGSGYGYYNYSSKWVTIQCATENGSDHPKETATGVWVSVTDHRADTEVTARACTQAVWGGAGGSCGPAYGSGVSYTGGAVLYPSLSVWSDPTYRYYDAYIWTQLPPYSAGAGAMSGYEIAF